MLSRSRKAFTLLELIVVIVILGLLAALAIPTFQTIINKSKATTAETSAESVGRNAVAIAAIDEGRDLSFADVEEAAKEAKGVQVIGSDLGVGTVTGTQTVSVAVNGKVVDLVFNGSSVTGEYDAEAVAPAPVVTPPTGG